MTKRQVAERFGLPTAVIDGWTQRGLIEARANGQYTKAEVDRFANATGWPADGLTARQQGRRAAR